MSIRRALQIASMFGLGSVVLAMPAAAAPAPASAPMPVREDYAITPDGVRIYYRVAGSGPETVIAPFALYHGSSLDRLANGRRIVTYDPRGRGSSQAAPLDRVSLDYLLSDLDAVRQAVGAEKVAIIGWSGGGMETFVYTLRNPERVDTTDPAGAGGGTLRALWRTDDGRPPGADRSRSEGRL